jgi:hypothetical protein
MLEGCLWMGVDQVPSRVGFVPTTSRDEGGLSIFGVFDQNGQHQWKLSLRWAFQFMFVRRFVLWPRRKQRRRR